MRQSLDGMNQGERQHELLKDFEEWKKKGTMKNFEKLDSHTESVFSVW